jgi:hypothetical protein
MRSRMLRHKLLDLEAVIGNLWNSPEIGVRL